MRKFYDYDEVDALPRGEWIESSDGLPPPGREVIVETADGKVTALARYVHYDLAPPERGWWDNRYPGCGENIAVFGHITRWQPIPKPKNVTD